MNTNFNERLIYHYLLKETGLIEKVKPDFFGSSAFLQLCFKVVLKYQNKYKRIPNKNEIYEVMQNNKQFEEYDLDTLELVYSIDLTNYDEKYLSNYTQNWIKFNSYQSSMQKAVELMNQSQFEPDDVEKIDKLFNDVKSNLESSFKLDFNTTPPIRFSDLSSHLQIQKEKISSGFKMIDDIQKGYQKGTLISFLGQPKVGKTMWLCNQAERLFKQGRNVAYVSLEVNESIILKRIGANSLNIPMDDYEDLAKDETYMKRKWSEMTTTQLNPVGEIVVKQMASPTVNQIESYLLNVEEKNNIKFDAIIIDYIALISNNTANATLYEKIKNIAECLRAMAMRNEWIVITASQIKTNGYDKSDLGMEDVAESSGLNNTVDLLLGIIRPPNMLINKKYTLKIIAIRDGASQGTIEMFNYVGQYARITEESMTKKPLIQNDDDDDFSFS